MSLSRIKALPRSNVLEGVRIIVTGCGYKPLEHTFYDAIDGSEAHDHIEVEGRTMKLNIGAATSAVLAANGAIVHMVSLTESKLSLLAQELVKNLHIATESIEYSARDLLDEHQVKTFVNELPKDKPIWLVQSIGLGAGAYKLKDDNPYLHIEDIPVELLEKESLTVLRGTHLLMQALIPVFREQNSRHGVESKVVVVSSMSAVRGYDLGGTHCAAKGAISRYTNSAMLDLWKEKIYLTDIRPGAIDTGMYDNPVVQASALQINKGYGDSWKAVENICLAPPTSVGQVIANVLMIPAHVTSINLCAKGQFPNEGS